MAAAPELRLTAGEVLDPIVVGGGEFGGRDGEDHSWDGVIGLPEADPAFLSEAPPPPNLRIQYGPAASQVAELRPDIFERLGRWYAIGRVGQPDHVAAAAVFLGSDDALLSVEQCCPSMVASPLACTVSHANWRRTEHRSNRPDVIVADGTRASALLRSCQHEPYITVRLNARSRVRAAWQQRLESQF